MEGLMGAQAFGAPPLLLHALSETQTGSGWRVSDPLSALLAYPTRPDKWSAQHAPNLSFTLEELCATATMILCR
eukprot:1159608-Pelagomonas_calceolata.AAC.7